MFDRSDRVANLCEPMSFPSTRTMVPNFAAKWNVLSKLMTCFVSLITDGRPHRGLMCPRNMIFRLSWTLFPIFIGKRNFQTQKSASDWPSRLLKQVVHRHLVLNVVPVGVVSHAESGHEGLVQGFARLAVVAEGGHALAEVLVVVFGDDKFLV